MLVVNIIPVSITNDRYGPNWPKSIHTRANDIHNPFCCSLLVSDMTVSDMRALDYLKSLYFSVPCNSRRLLCRLSGDGKFIDPLA